MGDRLAVALGALKNGFPGEGLDFPPIEGKFNDFRCYGLGISRHC
jgi:hypothetical protein